jgi:hypothetical protein
MSRYKRRLVLIQECSSNSNEFRHISLFVTIRSASSVPLCFRFQTLLVLSYRLLGFDFWKHRVTEFTEEGEKGFAFFEMIAVFARTNYESTLQRSLLEPEALADMNRRRFCEQLVIDTQNAALSTRE